MPTAVILHIRGRPGTAERLKRAVHDIGAARASEPAFPGGMKYVDNDDPEHVVEVQTWDSTQAHQSFMARISGDFADAFAFLAEPPNVTYADD